MKIVYKKLSIILPDVSNEVAKIPLSLMEISPIGDKVLSHRGEVPS
jgi:hypothetical protein